MIDLDGSVAAHTDEPPPPSAKSGESVRETSMVDQLLDELVADDTGAGEADRMLSDPDNWSTEGVSDGPLADDMPEGLDKSFATGEIPNIGKDTSSFDEAAKALDEQEEHTVSRDGGDFDGLLGDADEDLEGAIDSSGLEDEFGAAPTEEQLSSETDQGTNQGEYEGHEQAESDSSLSESFEPEAGDSFDGNENGPGQASDDFADDQPADHYDGEYEQSDEVYGAGGGAEASVDEIAEYGNSEASQKGTILYSLTVGSIDSKELREELKEVLSDKRLMLNVEELIAAISDGELTIGGLSSLKTFVLVSQLIGLPVALEWRQHVEAHP